MSSTLSALSITGTVQASVSPNIATLSGNVFVSDQSNLVIVPGSAAGQADGAFTKVGSVTAGTPVVIDLTTLTDPFGQALTVAHVAVLKISNTSAPGSGTLSHGGGTNPIYASIPADLAITPGDFFETSFNGVGLPVASGSKQNLTLTASTGTVTYRVTALVRSA